jgi:hypothetical protein
MEIRRVINLKSIFDCERVNESLSRRYEEDTRPYEVYVLGNFKGNRMQVRLDLGGPAGSSAWKYGWIVLRALTNSFVL